MSHRVVRVARLGKPHGIKGEVTAEVFTDSPENRFVRGHTFLVRRHARANLMYNQLTLENARWNKRILLLKFVELTDRNTAEAMRDSELYVPVDDLREQETGWYAEDLVGYSVHCDSFESLSIGKVSGLITTNVQDLLQVALEDGREVLVPFVEEIVPQIDDYHCAVIITPPPGLLELNQD